MSAPDYFDVYYRVEGRITVTTTRPLVGESIESFIDYILRTHDCVRIVGTYTREVIWEDAQ